MTRRAGACALLLAAAGIVPAAAQDSLQLPRYTIPSPAGDPKPLSREAARCPDCGVIVAIKEVDARRAAPVGGRTSPNDPINQGSSLEPGYPVGWVASYRFGDDQGLSKSYVGAIGEKQLRETFTDTSYEVTVRMYDGSYRVLGSERYPDWDIGETVRVVENHLQAPPPRPAPAR